MKIRVWLLPAISYVLLLIHILISSNYIDAFTVIGLGYATAKILMAYAIGDFFIILGFISILFRQDKRFITSIICLILSIPFLLYILEPGFVMSFWGGYSEAPEKYMKPDFTAAVDLFLILGLVLTSALSRRRRRSEVLS